MNNWIGPVSAGLAALRVNTLAESWKSVPLMVMTPEIVVFPAPPMPRMFPPAPIAPEIVSSPASAWIRVEEATVIAPLMTLLPEMLRNAPSFEMPVPLRTSGSAMVIPPLT